MRLNALWALQNNYHCLFIFFPLYFKCQVAYRFHSLECQLSYRDGFRFVSLVPVG